MKETLKNFDQDAYVLRNYFMIVAFWTKCPSNSLSIRLWCHSSRSWASWLVSLCFFIAMRQGNHLKTYVNSVNGNILATDNIPSNQIKSGLKSDRQSFFEPGQWSNGNVRTNSIMHSFYNARRKSLRNIRRRLGDIVSDGHGSPKASSNFLTHFRFAFCKWSGINQTMQFECLWSVNQRLSQYIAEFVNMSSESIRSSIWISDAQVCRPFSNGWLPKWRQ